MSLQQGNNEMEEEISVSALPDIPSVNIGKSLSFSQTPTPFIASLSQMDCVDLMN